MTNTLLDRLTETHEGMRLYQQERAIQEITDLICETMEEEGVTRAELARRLGTTKGYITKLLDGQANMTIRKVADVLGVLDRAVHVRSGPLREPALESSRFVEVQRWDWEASFTWSCDVPTAQPDRNHLPQEMAA